MTSPFDPRTWLPGLSGLPGLPGQRATGDPERSWLEAWSELTTWWTAPLAAATDAMTDAMRPEQLLAQLIDGIATRFSGKRIVISVGGRRVPAMLDSLRLFHRDERFEVRLDLRDVEVQGVHFDEISAVARSVSISPGTQPTIVARDIETEGSASLADLVRWLDERTHTWTLTIDRDGDVVARHVDKSVAFVVEPSVRNGEAFLELRQAAWSRLRVPVPRWLRLERRVDLDLEGDWSLMEARRSDTNMHFRLRRDQIVHSVHPARLRDAVMRGEMLEL